MRNCRHSKSTGTQRDRQQRRDRRLTLIAMMLAGSLALYAQLGAPGYGDLPLEVRIAASEQARADRLSQA